MFVGSRTVKSPSVARRSPGWTIVELLVAVGVMGVLLAILIPVLGGAKVSATEVAVLAHQREVGRELQRYITDHQDRFPFYGKPGTLRAHLAYYPLRDRPTSHAYRNPDHYWAQPLFWSWVLEGEGYNGGLARQGPELREDWYRAEDGYEEGVSIDWLTFGAYAPPSFFRSSDPQLHSDHQPQRAGLVKHPSLKGALSRANHVRGGGGRHGGDWWLFVYFFDGHGERLRASALRPGVFVRDGGGPIPVLTTELGLEGVDK